MPASEKFKPDVLIEIKAEKIASFRGMLPEMNYQVVKEFPNPVETNFYLEPDDRR